MAGVVRRRSSCCTATSSTGKRSPWRSPARRWSPCATCSPLAREMRRKIPGGPPRRTWIPACLPDLEAMRHLAWSWNAEICWNGDFAKFRKFMRIDGERWGIWSYCWTRWRLSKSEPELEHGGHVKQRSGVKAKLTPLASSLMQSSIRLISGMSSGLILLGH